jgi:hypothetical protein
VTPLAYNWAEFGEKDLLDQAWFDGRSEGDLAFAAEDYMMEVWFDRT